MTGATGFVGAHVVDNLLKRGFRVRGAARSAKKAEQMLAAHPEYASQLDFVLIADIGKEGAFDKAVKEVNGVIHVASVSTDVCLRTYFPLDEQGLTFRHVRAASQLFCYRL